jgi:hypothetical protein
MRQDCATASLAQPALPFRQPSFVIPDQLDGLTGASFTFSEPLTANSPPFDDSNGSRLLRMKRNFPELIYDFFTGALSCGVFVETSFHVVGAVSPIPTTVGS